MKRIALAFSLVLSFIGNGQNHSSNPVRFIFESVHDHLGNLDLNSKKVQLFSPDHRLIYQADMYEGKELDEQFFYYTEDGKLLRDHRIFHKPHESGDYRMTYDAKGNLIEEANYNDVEHILEKITMTYNDKGQMLTRQVEFYHHTEDQMIVEEKFTYEYQPDGKIASRTGFEGEHEDRTVTYKYKHEDKTEIIMKYNSAGEIREKWIKKVDDKGRLLQDVHSVYQNNVPQTKTIDFIYNEHDHILSETLSKTGSTLTKQILFEYKYDDHGNWIERKEKKVAGVKETEGVYLKRHIEYYEHADYDHAPMELDENFLYETHDGKEVKVFQETHVRINNNEGQLEWVVRRNGPILYQVDEYEYENGKLVLINHLNNEHHENAYTRAKKNESGEVAEFVTYSSNDKVDEKTAYTYNEKGQLIKSEEFVVDNASGMLQLVITEEYTYDDKNRVTEMSLTEFGEETNILYEYDALGNVVKEIQTPKAKGEDVITTVYVYKEKVLVSKQVFVGKSKEARDEIKYEYNPEGDLVKSVDFRAGKIHSEVDYVNFK